MAFTTSKGFFEPTVIFFRLANSPGIFQTIINKILQNLINTGEVTSFIDDIIMGTEEEEHDEVVEKVVKMLVENNLYVKPKKSKWKVREVKFLGVVIKPEEIKIEEEKTGQLQKELRTYRNLWDLPTTISSLSKILQ